MLKTVSLLLMLMMVSQANAVEECRLLANVETATHSSMPQVLTRVGESVYFFALDQTHGFELWRTDQASGTTALVKDMVPGSNSPTVTATAALGDRLIIFAKNAANTEDGLWISDGTSGGTSYLKTLRLNGAASVSGITLFKNRLFFIAVDNTGARGLWATDGTANGTTLIHPANYSTAGWLFPAYHPPDAAATPNLLFFQHSSSAEGYELWATDGTTAGCFLVKDLQTGITNSSPLNFFAAGDKVYFNAAEPDRTCSLYVSDGTAAGTQKLSVNSDASPTVFASIGNSVFFRWADGGSNLELWKTDGTVSGTVKVKEIYPGATGSYPDGFAALGQTLYFTAKDATLETALWKTDGTAAGTVKVSTGLSLAYGEIAALGSNLIFSASSPDSGHELRRLNANGTISLLKDIYPGTTGSNPMTLLAAAGMLYFTAENNLGKELWQTNGTNAGTVMTYDINRTPFDSDPSEFIDLNNKIYFFANTAAYGRELWKSDGSKDGTVLAADLNPGRNGSSPSNLRVMQDHLYFFGNNGADGMGLCRSDGTPAGTEEFAPIQGEQGGAPELTNLTVHNNQLLFFGHDGSKMQLYRSDGTADGSVFVKLLRQITGSCWSQDIFSSGPDLFFTIVTDSIYPHLVYRSNGQPGGTVIVDSTSEVRGMTPWNGKFYFVDWQADSGLELHVMDPVNYSRNLLCDINPGTTFGFPEISTDANHTDPLEFLPSPGGIFFSATNGSAGYELWITNGTQAGTRMVKDICPGAASSYPEEFALLNGKAVFFADNGQDGRELWISDGTEQGTRMVKNASTLAGSYDPKRYPERRIVACGKIFYNFDDGTNGAEIWASDGTESGTYRVKNINPGQASSSPSEFYYSRGRIYFAATDSSNGREPWVLFPQTAVRHWEKYE